MVSFGLYIGNTSACIALFKKGKVDVISNDVGERLTPSIVAYTSSDLIVGFEAKQCMKQSESCVISKMKMMINNGENGQESNSLYKIKYKDGKIFYEINRKDKATLISVEEILSSIFKKLMECAKSQVGVLETYEAVVSVPFHFKNEQRKIIGDAATAAGFKILRMVSEAASAILAYNIGQENNHENLNILVVRIGGESMDISLVNVINGMYRIIDHYYNSDLGGHLIDSLIADFFKSDFQRQTRLDCSTSTRAMFKILSSAESCKRILSNLNTTNCSLESLHQDKDFNCALSRSRLELMAGPLVQKWVSQIDCLLQKCNMDARHLHKIILCGGMCRMPLVQQTIKDKFLEVECMNSIPPDEIYATGAAIQASLLSGKEIDILNRNDASNKISCLSQSIIIQQTESDHKEILFPINCPIPVKKHLDFSIVEGTTNCTLLLKQQDPDDDSKISLLGKITINDITCSILNVSFNIKQDGSLHVHWKSGKDMKLQFFVIAAD